MRRRISYGLGNRQKQCLGIHKKVPLCTVGAAGGNLPNGAAKSEEPEVQSQPAETQPPPELQDSLADILSRIAGAGKVEVLLTEAAGEQICYQTDEDISTGENASDMRRETVLVTNADREETGLVKQVNPPTYLGAIVLCQGADNATIRLSIVEAVMSVTGLSSDRITVLKMQ